MPGGDYRDALRTRAAWTPVAGAGRRRRRHTARRAPRRRPATPSASAAGSGVALGEPRYVSRIDAATNTIVLGRRADLETRARSPLDDVSFVAGTPPAGTTTPFRAADPDPPSGGPGPGDRPPRDGPTSRTAVAAGRSRPTPGLGGRTRPGGRPLRRRGRPRRRPDRPRLTPGRRPARTYTGRVIGPALVLAVLVGIFSTAIYVLIRGSVGGRLPARAPGRDPRGLGRRLARRTARDRHPPAGRLPRPRGVRRCRGSGSASCRWSPRSARRVGGREACPSGSAASDAARVGHVPARPDDRRARRRGDRGLADLASPDAATGQRLTLPPTARPPAPPSRPPEARPRLRGRVWYRYGRCRTPDVTPDPRIRPCPPPRSGGASSSSSPSAATRSSRRPASSRPATRRSCSRTRGWSSSRTS